MQHSITILYFPLTVYFSGQQETRKGAFVRNTNEYLDKVQRARDVVHVIIDRNLVRLADSLESGTMQHTVDLAPVLLEECLQLGEVSASK